MDKIVSYTTIQHEFRIENKLTCNEYVVADIINFLSTARKYSDNSWISINRESIAEQIGISRRSLLNILTKLIDLGFVEKMEGSSKVRSSEKWQEVYLNDGKKVPKKWEESSQHDGKKVPKKWEESSQKSATIPYSIRINRIYTEFFDKDSIFEKLYELYDKKISKAAALKKFKKISEKDYQKIFDAVEPYVRSTPDPQYRKHLVTWLNNSGWEDYENYQDSDMLLEEISGVKKLENNEW